MNMKIKLQEFASRLTDSTASTSTSGTEKYSGGVRLEKKPGLCSRLRSLLAQSHLATGLGRARRHIESAVQNARLYPIKQRTAPTRKAAAAVSVPVTDVQSQPKRTAFKKPPSEPPPLPPQASPFAQQADKASATFRQVPRALKKAPPSEAPPKPPLAQDTAPPKGKQGTDSPPIDANKPPAEDDLDNALDSLLGALKDDDASSSADRADLPGKPDLGESRAVAPDKDSGVSFDEVDRLLNDMNSAILMDKALKALESPANPAPPKT